MANNYTKSIISKVKWKMDTKIAHISSNENQDEDFKGFVTLPYIKGLTGTCSSSETLRKCLSNPKDKVNLDKQNNIVYKIPCQDCNAVYIGETKRSFKQRSSEHMRAVKNGEIEKNEIADHCCKLDHKFNWEEKSIIDKEQNWVSRKVKETIHSIKDKNHINSISFTLPNIWLPALRKSEKLPPRSEF